MTKKTLDKCDASEFPILVAEDDEILGRAIVEYLQQETYPAVWAADGREAIARLRADRYHLVITDLLMPQADGLEVLRQVRQQYDQTLVVIITGYAAIQTAMAAVEEGAYDYLIKPFNLKELLVVVANARRLVSLWRQNQQLCLQLKEYEELLQAVPWTAPVEQATSQETIMPSIPGYRRLPPPAAIFQPQTSGREVVDELERLAQLQRGGFLSTEEYRHLKKALLSG